MYNEDKKHSTENFEKYIELIKQNKGEEALDALGVDLRINSIEKSLATMNELEK